MTKPGRMMRVEVVPFSHLAQQRPLDWPPPMRELFQRPEAAEFVWRRMQYVFELPDPRTLAPERMALTDDERRLLARFVEQARKLAARA